MYKVILSILILYASIGCTNTGNTPPAIERQPNVVAEYPVASQINSININITGTYRGTLPCADCGGIEVTLRLRENNEYVLKTRHISDQEGTKDIEAEYDGKYSWDGGLGIVTLHGITNQPHQYKYSDGLLIQLDINGNRRSGPLAERYILRK